jgi:hypothetical protein
MQTESGPAKLYRAWHAHFREIMVPWSTLSAGNRSKWTAVYNEVQLQSANAGELPANTTAEESANKND